MKRLILAAATAAALLACACQPDPARAATYTVTTSADDEAAITLARTRYNADLPPIVVDEMGNQIPNPALKTSNAEFMAMTVRDHLATWGSAAVQATLSVREKAAAATILQAAIDRNDDNSAAAQALLNRLNGAP